MSDEDYWDGRYGRAFEGGNHAEYNRGSRDRDAEWTAATSRPSPRPQASSEGMAAMGNGIASLVILAAIVLAALVITPFAVFALLVAAGMIAFGNIWSPRSVPDFWDAWRWSLGGVVGATAVLLLVAYGIEAYIEVDLPLGQLDALLLGGYQSVARYLMWLAGFAVGERIELPSNLPPSIETTLRSQPLWMAFGTFLVSLPSVTILAACLRQPLADSWSGIRSWLGAVAAALVIIGLALPGYLAGGRWLFTNAEVARPPFWMSWSQMLGLSAGVLALSMLLGSIVFAVVLRVLRLSNGMSFGDLLPTGVICVGAYGASLMLSLLFFRGADEILVWAYLDVINAAVPPPFRITGYASVDANAIGALLRLLLLPLGIGTYCAWSRLSLRSWTWTQHTSLVMLAPIICTVASATAYCIALHVWAQRL